MEVAAPDSQGVQALPPEGPAQPPLVASDEKSAQCFQKRLRLLPVTSSPVPRGGSLLQTEVKDLEWPCSEDQLGRKRARGKPGSRSLAGLGFGADSVPRPLPRWQAVTAMCPRSSSGETMLKRYFLLSPCGKHCEKRLATTQETPRGQRSRGQQDDHC